MTRAATTPGSADRTRSPVLQSPVVLLLGFLTWPAAFVLLGMTAIIEIFIYPLAWPTHLQWAAMLLVLLCRGPGALSVDPQALAQKSL